MNKSTTYKTNERKKKGIELASAYAEEMRQIVGSCCESVQNASSMTEAWNAIDRCYQDIEALRNNQKCTGSKSFALKNIVNNDVEGHTKYLQGINLPIMVNTVASDDNEFLPSGVCEMHIGEVNGIETVLITPDVIAI